MSPSSAPKAALSIGRAGPNALRPIAVQRHAQWHRGTRQTHAATIVAPSPPAARSPRCAGEHGFGGVSRARSGSELIAATAPRGAREDARVLRIDRIF